MPPIHKCLENIFLNSKSLPPVQTCKNHSWQGTWSSPLDRCLHPLVSCSGKRCHPGFYENPGRGSVARTEEPMFQKATHTGWPGLAAKNTSEHTIRYFYNAHGESLKLSPIYRGSVSESRHPNHSDIDIIEYWFSVILDCLLFLFLFNVLIILLIYLF